MDVTPLVLAAEEGAGHSNPLVLEANEMIWGAVSFLIFFLIMTKLVFPKLSKTLVERTESIEGNLEKAAAEREQAQALLRQYEAKLEEARVEAGKIVEQARSNAGRLEAELKTKAEEEANRIVERARQSVAAERDRAIEQLRSEVGVIAVDLAARVIGDSLDRDRQLDLVDNYVAELQRQGR